MSTAKTARAKNIKTEAGETLASLHEPPREEIERRAYELFVARGEVPGFDQDDWLQAERELRET
jgi:hypothetical protein